jgi:preprotein translocase subunit SecA
VPIQRENQTLASITFQNYFRMYKKLAGMTGTADTEAYEFQQIYGLEVIGHPDPPPDGAQGRDRIWCSSSAKAKFVAIIEDIKDVMRASAAGAGRHHLDRTSELLGRHAQEGRHPARGAERQAARARGAHRGQAGRPGAVTIATNMAGRGTDIVLGGSLEAELHALGRDASDAPKEAVRRRVAAAPRRGARRRRPAHHRHRAARVPPHRQPAARPLRPPGRRRAPAASTCRWKTT